MLVGDEEDGSVDSASLYSFSQLQRLIQASDSQLQATLHSLFAFEVRGCLRLLQPAYQHALVTDILSAVTETQQSPLHVDAEAIAATLAHLHDPLVTTQAVQLLSPYTAHSYLSAHHSLCPRILTRLHAAHLFSSSPSIPSSILLPSLSSRLPPPLTLDPSHLLGLALLIPTPALQSAANPAYHWLPVWALASDVKGRLVDLFGVKERWSLEEITGWLHDLTAVDEKVEALLMRHARTVTDKTPNGRKRVLYTRR